MLPNNPTPSDVHQAIRSLEAGSDGGTGGGDIKAATIFPNQYPVEFFGGYPLMNLPGMQQSYLDNMVMLVVNFSDYNVGARYSLSLVKDLLGEWIVDYNDPYGGTIRISYHDGYLDADNSGPEMYGLIIYYRA